MAMFNSCVVLPEGYPQLSIKVFFLLQPQRGLPILPIEGEPREFTESTEPGADWDGMRRDISATIFYS